MATRFSRLKPAIIRMTLMASAVAMSVSSAHAQDPLSRFLDGVFKPEPETPQYTQPVEPSQELPPPDMELQPSVPPDVSSEAVQESPQPVLAPQEPVPSPAMPSPPSRKSPSPRGTRAVAPTLTETPTQPAPAPQPVTEVPSEQTIAKPLPPLPPPRPAGIGGPTAVAAAAPVGQPAATPVASAAPASPVAQAHPMPRTSAEAVARVSAYLNGINTLTARFLQTGADRRQVGGTLYVQRPGRLRFAYDPPSTLEIVADGRSVAVRDSKLRTNDVYSIGQTPLKFLLRDHVDLARDVQVKDVQIDPDGPIDITLEDSATLGGTSKVTLRFDARANVLREWMIVDPQGYETTVRLSAVQIVPR